MKNAKTFCNFQIKSVILLLQNGNAPMIKHCETKHNQHRRSYWHDYYQKGLYMITMVIDGRKPLFGTIVGHANGQPGTNNSPHIILSDLGQRVLQDEVPKIHQIYPEVDVWRVAMMPDHIHLLLRVTQTGSSDYASFHQLNDYAREICEATEMRIIGYSDLMKA